MKVCVYVEGGGPTAGSSGAAACRRAFSSFFQKILGDGPKPKIVACGSRDEAYNDFSRELTGDSEYFAVLLVDSEDPVADGKSASEHLRGREKHWKPVADGQAHLMVQCMETWFLADKKALADYYTKGFVQSALPRNLSIESISKPDVMKGLEDASKPTKKGKYHKTRHGFEILERIDPEKVAKASPFAKDLIAVLRKKLTN